MRQQTSGILSAKNQIMKFMQHVHNIQKSGWFEIGVCWFLFLIVVFSLYQCFFVKGNSVMLTVRLACKNVMTAS